MRTGGQVNESVLKTEEIINFGDNGGDVIREPHLLVARRDQERQMLAAYASVSLAATKIPWPARSGYPCACIENAIALIIHIPYSARSQYFSFSTISYESSQYTINRKHPTMYRDTQMELFAFDRLKSLDTTIRCKHRLPVEIPVAAINYACFAIGLQVVSRKKLANRS